MTSPKRGKRGAAEPATAAVLTPTEAPVTVCIPPSASASMDVADATATATATATDVATDARSMGMLCHILSSEHFALALAPGFYRFYAHIGVLQALEQVC
jgi:hypothetical protein